MKVSIGKAVPDFAAETNKGSIKLSDYKHKYLVVYFYPKDNTPGCSVEAQNFRDLYESFQKHNSEIIGVSRDNLASHTKFECKYNLPFPLISDTDSKISNMFEVIKEKSIFSKTALGVERSTFLISPEGVLIKEWRKVKVANHAQEVLDEILVNEIRA